MNLLIPHKRSGWIAWGTTFALFSCAQNPPNGHTTNIAEPMIQQETGTTSATDTIVLGAGCFWCVEAVFAELNGVKSVLPGYTGGAMKNPDYKSVCTGETGHAEVAEIIFDPSVVTLPEILEVFWQTHDPTTLNRQGADVGTQYRSAIFYHTAEQRQVAASLIAELDSDRLWAGPIVTELLPRPTFFAAEPYHQQYFRRNPDQGYCQVVVSPKLAKFRRKFANRLKANR